MQILQQDAHVDIANQLRFGSNSASLKQNWRVLVTSNAGRLGMDSNAIVEQLCYDGYGTLLNLDFRTNLATLGITYIYADPDCGAVVWSSGKNGLDESGRGDDIFLRVKRNDN
jgi:hypothetical protein